MPLAAYRAKQSTDTGGTGTIVLNAAASNAQSFAAAFGASSRRVMYAISWTTGFEIGLGDFDGGTPGSLTRATVLRSSNSNALVALPAGTKDVFAVFEPAAREVVSFSATATLALADLGNAAIFTGASAATLNLPAVATVPIGAGWLVINAGTAALTIDPNGAELLNGAATLVLQPGQSAMVLREASAWRAALMMGPNVTGNLSVSGNLSVTGEMQSTGPVRLPAGTALLPGITPSGDPDTGLYAPAANVLAVSLNGVEVARWEAGRYQMAGSDGATLHRIAGASYALRLQSLASTGMNVEAMNPTEATFQPLLLGGSAIDFRLSGTKTGGITSGGDFQFNSGYGSAATAYGCRAWVNFNGTGTVAIRASGNVSSITDNGVGDYTVNFTNAMPDANYAAFVMATWDGGPNFSGHRTTSGQTVNGFRALSGLAGGGAADSSVMTAMVFR